MSRVGDEVACMESSPRGPGSPGRHAPPRLFSRELPAGGRSRGRRPRPSRLPSTNALCMASAALDLVRFAPTSRTA